MVEFFFFAITQIFSEGIITCHRCRCCFCPRGSCSRAQRAGGAFVEDAHLISAINWQRCTSQETLGLRLKAVHLLLRGWRVAAGWRSSTGRSLSGVARACRGVGGRRKYVICGVTANWHPPFAVAALIQLPPQVQLSHSLRAKEAIFGSREKVTNKVRSAISTDRCSKLSLRGETSRPIDWDETSATCSFIARKKPDVRRGEDDGEILYSLREGRPQQQVFYFLLTRLFAAVNFIFSEEEVRWRRIVERPSALNTVRAAELVMFQPKSVLFQRNSMRGCVEGERHWCSCQKYPCRLNTFVFFCFFKCTQSCWQSARPVHHPVWKTIVARGQEGEKVLLACNLRPSAPERTFTLVPNAAVIYLVTASAAF